MSFVALEIYHFGRLTMGGVEKYKHGMGWSLGGEQPGGMQSGKPVRGICLGNFHSLFRSPVTN